MLIQPQKLSDLKKEFDFIAKSHCENIAGVWRVDAQNPGPILGITMCTHGNEPSGLAALRYLRLTTNIEKTLRNGSIIFTLNNLLAARAFFNSKNKAKKGRARFVDINFNRLPANAIRLKNDERYEIKRANELYPIWKKFDFAIDIHSTSQKSNPMIIAGKNLNLNLIKGFPINAIISNIDKIQIGKPAFSFYGQPTGSIPLLEIECGSHVNPLSFRRAIISAMALLKNLNMIDGKSTNKTQKHTEYFIKSSVMFSDKSNKLVKVFKNYEFIKKGALIAVNDRHTIHAPFNCHAFMGPQKTKPTSIAEEVLFLSKPKKYIKLS